MWTVVVIGTLLSFSGTARDLDDCRNIVALNGSSLGQIKEAYCISVYNPNDRVNLLEK